MSPSVATRTWGRSSTTDHATRRPLVILVAIGLVVGALITPRLALPNKVPPLTIANATPYTVTIEANDGNDPGWAPIAIVPAERTILVSELIDVGSEWNLRFTSQGTQLEGYQVSRSELASDGWRYAVPDDVAERLQAAGEPPSP